MGFHEETSAKKKTAYGIDNKTNPKKNKFGLKKLAKNLIKKTRQTSDDNEALIGTDDNGTGNQQTGRSIEVLPGEEIGLDCACAQVDVDHDVDRGHCDVCGGVYGRRTRRGNRHVTFSSDLNPVSEESLNPDHKEGKKKKKHKKLKKARKVTWKVMKKSWKYLRIGLQMFAASPGGVATGSVVVTNIVNNPTGNMGYPHRR